MAGVSTRAVIFDLYDTLVDGATTKRRELIADMATELGVDSRAFQTAFRDSYRQRFLGELGDLAQTITTLSRRCGVDPEPDLVAAAAATRLEYTRTLLTPLPGVLEALSTLTENSWRLGLVTNCSIETDRLWEESVLAQYIHQPVFSCRVGVCKPDPAIFRLATAALEVEPHECVYVADGAGGELVAARDLGMTTIRVRAADVDHDTFGDIGDWDGPVIDDLSQLVRLLPDAPA